MDLASILSIGTTIWNTIQSIFSFTNALEEQDLAEEEYNLNLELQETDIKNQLAQLDLSQTEASGQIDLLSQYLGNFDSSAQLETTTYEQEGKESLQTLLSNYGDINEVASATGQTQGKLLNQGKAAYESAVSYAGADLALGGEGAAAGTYELGLTELTNQLALDKSTAQKQLELYQTTLGTLSTTKTNLEAALAAIQAARTDTTTTETTTTTEEATTDDPAEEERRKQEENGSTTEETESTYDEDFYSHILDEEEEDYSEDTFLTGYGDDDFGYVPPDYDEDFYDYILG